MSLLGSGSALPATTASSAYLTHDQGPVRWSGTSGGWYPPALDGPATLATNTRPLPHGHFRLPRALWLQMVGTTFGRYRIVDTRGAGGMGIVYRAEDLVLHRPVALKFLPADVAFDDEWRARLLREARLAAALNHPNICTVYEVGEAGISHSEAADLAVPAGTPFIAMEYVEGETLAERIARQGRLPPGDALDVAVQIAEGLAEAHGLRIVHRDLKPSNVMITPRGRVKILDFGLAKPLSPIRDAGAKITTSEAISIDLGHLSLVGTCAYMSPEQALGKAVGAPSDVFAFGIMLHEMLTGSHPFQADTAAAVLAKIIEGAPAPLALSAGDCSENLVAIVARCLRKRPDERYSDAREVVTGLAAVRRHLLDDEARTTTTGAPAAAGSGSAMTGGDVHPRRWRVAVGLTLLLVGGLVTFSLVQRTRGPTGDPGTNSQPPAPEAPVPPQTDAPPARRGVPATVAAPVPSPGERPGSGARPHVPQPSVSQTGVPLRRDASAPPRTARLRVASTPAAAVSLDGRLVGVTPLSLDVPPGTRELMLTSPAGLRWRGKITLHAGENLVVSRNLAETGNLAIVSDVWAEVSLDDGPLEQTPIHFSRLPAGLHELRAFRDGYVPQRLEVVVEAGETTRLRLTMEKKP